MSKEEQDKDRAQLYPAITKTQAYLAGTLDISTICKQYGLDEDGRVR